MSKIFECSFSCTYEADTPEEAVKIMLSTIQNYDWFVHARDIETDEKFIVDTETWVVEEN